MIAVAAVAGSMLLLIIGEEILVSRVEQPDYRIETADGPIELRRYPPLVVAQVETSGDRKAAISDGFKMIAAYIFGKNGARRKIDMTVPVMQESAPAGSDVVARKWFVRFIMPRQWSLETLPKPTDQRVMLEARAAATYATIRFSGWAGQRSIEVETGRLSAFIAKRNLQPIGAPIYAFFNPPWVLPFLRRNEIMIEVRAS